MEEVALVDRLQAERREDRLVLALPGGTERLGPERALRARLLGERVPEVNGGGRQPPAPFDRLRPRRARSRRTSPRTATAPRTPLRRADDGRARRTSPCRRPARRRTSAPARR